MESRSSKNAPWTIAVVLTLVISLILSGQPSAWGAAKNRAAPALVKPNLPASSPKSKIPSLLTRKELQGIAAAGKLILEEYVNPVDSKSLYHGALRGMAQALDPHSQFLDPQEYKDFLDSLVDGSKAGIGVGIVEKRKGQAKSLAAIVPDSPADAAGLKRGDKILTVAGHPAASMPLEAVGRRIQGPEGSRVTLKILRPGRASRARTVKITRAAVQSPNVLSKRLPHGVGYLYFELFREGSAKEVLAQIRQLIARGATALILDIRNNVGGIGEEAVAIAAAFLRQGQIVMRVQSRQGSEEKFIVPKDGEFKDLSLQVLVNGNSASSSEILAGALQDHKRARIVGSRTRGKGSAQRVIPLHDGSALKLTEKRWYTPLGRSIQKDDSGHGGIAPDIATRVAYDAEMKALLNLSGKLHGLPARKGVPDPTLEKTLKLALPVKL